MGIFRNDKPTESLSERLAELETKHAELGRTIRGLELEYIELYDKVRHQMSRMAKRYAPDVPPSVDQTPDSTLADGVDEISAKILARRNRPKAPA